MEDNFSDLLPKLETFSLFLSRHYKNYFNLYVDLKKRKELNTTDILVYTLFIDRLLKSGMNIIHVILVNNYEKKPKSCHNVYAIKKYLL